MMNFLVSGEENVNELFISEEENKARRNRALL